MDKDNTIATTDALCARLADDSALHNCRLEGAFAWPEAQIEVAFKDCEFVGCVLRGADLEGSQFSNCTFANVSLRSANMRDCEFTNCRFFIEEVASDFRYAQLRDACFERCDLTTVNFERASAHGLRLIRCQAQGVDFSNVDFGLTLARSQSLVSFEVRDSNLAYADLSGTYLPGAIITDCRLVHAVLQGCILSNAILVDTDLCNIQASGLKLDGADLRGALFNNLDPRTVDLAGARVSAEQGLSLLASLGIEVDLRT